MRDYSNSNAFTKHVSRSLPSVLHSPVPMPSSCHHVHQTPSILPTCPTLLPSNHRTSHTFTSPLPAPPLSNQFLSILISSSFSAGLSVPCLATQCPARLPISCVPLPAGFPTSFMPCFSKSSSFFAGSAQNSCRIPSSLSSRI